MKADGDRNMWARAGQYSALAVALPTCTFAGYLIGYLLDRVFDTSFLRVVFLLIGIAAGFMQLVRLVQRDK